MRLPRLIILLSVIAFQPVPSAIAGEFGNSFVGDEDESRKASSDALAGIENIFTALRLRELKRIDEGREHIVAAIKLLREASQRMEKIKISTKEDKKIPWDSNGITINDRVVVKEFMIRLKQKTPEKFSELYKAFANSTERMASLLDSLLKNGKAYKAEPIFPDVSKEIILYIQFGDIVSRIGRL